jgi:Protein of unknown function (DUF2950)
MFRLTIVAYITAMFALMAAEPAAPPGGQAFASADAAAQALVKAAKADNENELIDILGPSAKDIVSTRDPVADRKVRHEFAARAAQKVKLVAYHGRRDQKTLLAGNDEWPLPIPIVQVNGKWYFDTAQAREEILNRRIGGNELDAIEVCRGYVEAQNEYAEANHTANGAAYYAQKIISSPGHRDGLYWKGEPGISESPIDKIIAKAFAEGYYFKLLTAQGPHASGGEMSYLEDGVMTKGYALVAWPSDYGSTGIMTFLVSKTGIVYQKDLGPHTARIAAGYTAYDPDTTWAPVGQMTRR